MKNLGSRVYVTSSIPVGFSLYDQQGDLVCMWNGIAEAVSGFGPEDIVTHTWNPQHCSVTGGQAESGLYGIRADHFFFDSEMMPKHTVQIIN